MCGGPGPGFYKVTAFSVDLCTPRTLCVLPVIFVFLFLNLEPVHCSMSGLNCCFLTCIQISQEAGKVVWYSHLLRNFPQFVRIHTVKDFSVVNEAEIDIFMEFPCSFL